MPHQPDPIVRTRNLRRLLPCYRDQFGFRVLQHLPGVLAVLELHGARLQLWQCDDFVGHSYCVASLDGHTAEIFRLHASLVRASPDAVMEAKPALQPWGSWEFGLVDTEGNQVVFEQWIRGILQPVAPARRAT